MDTVRKATPEEIQSFEDRADITPRSDVLTFGGKDFAVVRTCTELDPIIFAESSNTQRRMIFGMALESILRFQGVQEIYFNVKASDTDFIKVLETWGAEPTSQEPELRFKKVL